MKFTKTFLSWIIGLFLLMTGIGGLMVRQVPFDLQLVIHQYQRKVPQ